MGLGSWGILIEKAGFPGIPCGPILIIRSNLIIKMIRLEFWVIGRWNRKRLSIISDKTLVLSMCLKRMFNFENE